MKLYSLYDKVGKKHLSVTLAETDADFVRTSLFAILMDYPISDVQAYCVGEFFNDSGLIIPCSPREVDWNCYKFPKSADSLEEDYLTISQIREKAIEKKKKFLELEKDKISDLEKLIDDCSVALKKDDLPDSDKQKLIDYRDSLICNLKVLEERQKEAE